jgi:hypothetical protein
MLNKDANCKKTVRYELFAENMNGTLVIKNLEQNNFFISTPKKILENKQLLQGFAPEHVTRINLVAGFT